MTLNVITFLESVHALWAGWEHTATCVSSKTVILRYLDAKYHIYLCVVDLLGIIKFIYFMHVYTMLIYHFIVMQPVRVGFLA